MWRIFQRERLQGEQLIEIYSFFVLLCFKSIIKNLREYYKEKIDVNLSDKIIKLIDEKKLNIIKKVNLATAKINVIGKK